VTRSREVRYCGASAEAAAAGKDPIDTPQLSLRRVKADGLARCFAEKPRLDDQEKLEGPLLRACVTMGPAAHEESLERESRYQCA